MRIFLGRRKIDLTMTHLTFLLGLATTGLENLLNFFLQQLLREILFVTKINIFL